jgi:hypothetical protein
MQPRSVVGPTSLDDLKRGASKPGESGNSPLQIPPWLDMARCERSRRFFAEHAAAAILAWHCSLVIGFSLPSLLSALVFTQASETPAKALMRYTRTALHLVSWHVGNIWDPQSKAHASIQNVRSLHAGVRGQMEKRMPGQTWISMYDMACVQSGFMGALTIVPSKFGINASDSILEDYVFFWRCIGYQLGIADEFNLCSLGKKVSDKIVWDFIDSVLMSDIAHPPQEYLPIAEAYISGMNLTTLGVPFFSVKSTLALSYWALGYGPGPLSLADRCRYYYLRLVLLFLGTFSPFRHSLNWAVLACVRKMGCRAGRDPEATSTCPFTGATVHAGTVCPHAFRSTETESCDSGAQTLLAGLHLTLVLLLPALFVSILTSMAGVVLILFAPAVIGYGSGLVAAFASDTLAAVALVRE